MKKGFSILLLTACLFLYACEEQQTDAPRLSEYTELPSDTLIFPDTTDLAPKLLVAADIHLTKDLLYDQYTLEDTYPYGDTVRSFKWETIRKCLAFVEICIVIQPDGWYCAIIRTLTAKPPWSDVMYVMRTGV